jgi:hypothetical protein
MNAIMKTIHMLCSALLLCAAFGTAQAQQVYQPPATQEQAAARALAERRQKMIAECEQNFGSEIDCTREVDTELRAEALQSGGRVIHLRPPH